MPKPRVIDRMMEAMTKDFANPSAVHDFGFKIEKEIDAVRNNILTYLGGSGGELIFTSGGTESNNMAIHALYHRCKRRFPYIVTSSVEHPSILECLKAIDRDKIKYVDIEEDGTLKIDRIIDQIDDKTGLLCLFHVNNELGSINDIEEVISRAKKKQPELLVHIDGVQAMGKIPINLKAFNCDTYSFSGHKIHGPKGIGGLYIKNGLDLEPLIYGGGQESGYRSGTENVPGIYGLGEAVNILMEEDIEDANKIKELKTYCIKCIKETIEDVHINSPKNSSDYILNISIADTKGEVLLHILEQEEIYVSTASACASNGRGHGLSYVIEALNLPYNYSQGTLRICFSSMNTKDEIDQFIESLGKAVKSVRQLTRR